MTQNKQGQSFFDKVIEQTGNIENVFEMALINGKSITADLIIGESLKTSGKINNSIVELFGENNKPATALNNDLLESIVNPGGIGFMKIQSTFKVS